MNSAVTNFLKKPLLTLTSAATQTQVGFLASPTIRLDICLSSAAPIPAPSLLGYFSAFISYNIKPLLVKVY